MLCYLKFSYTNSYDILLTLTHNMTYNFLSLKKTATLTQSANKEVQKSVNLHNCPTVSKDLFHFKFYLTLNFTMKPP